METSFGERGSKMLTLVLLCAVITSQGTQAWTTIGWDTTGQPSCRYRCGYDMGSCACYSSCEYYGNCCSDYHSYCGQTTTQQTPAWTTTQQTPAWTTTQQTPAWTTTQQTPAWTTTQQTPAWTTTQQTPAWTITQQTPAWTTTQQTPAWTTTTTTPGWTTAQPTHDYFSCRYNCGYHMASCSCHSSCSYYGNCCHDYSYYCSGTTTQTPPTTTTGQVTTTSYYSCRHNCGYHMGACSCDSSCRYRGTCCHDYSFYCPETTPPPPPPFTTTTGQVTSSSRHSCRYNCGYHMGSCSCQSSCRNYGNCCHDYDRYCYSTTTPSYTTAASSCRNHCGADTGYCSCRSSCQYYGNCCYDFYDYCPYLTTTTTRRPTTDSPSCHNNCGSYMGNCSCSSSCEYRGNCCDDYYSYCYYTTYSPVTGGSCGGSLSGSGSFSSPNYPDYYHDYSNCIWQIRASSDQNLYLTFTFLQLENCCSCDYIKVYDGPSVGYGLLGTVCNENFNDSTRISFHSSSNYLTVVFRTDGSVVGRGFNAEFSSSLSPHLGRVDCSSDNMNIVISRNYLNSIGIDAYNLYLNDQYCRPDISYYNVVFNFPINTCGTVREFNDGRIVYTNALRSFSSNYGEITRQSLFRLNVSCRMEQDSVSQIIYEVGHSDNVSISGSGRYNTSMAFYTSSSFYYQVTQVPYEVRLNQYLYVQVSLRRGDSTLVVFLDTCVASPSPHDFQTRSYDLIRNGCRVDSTFYTYSSGTSPYARFRFQAFQFLRATDHVYIQCKVLICPASDYNSRCRRGCNRRKVRDLGSEHHESETVVLGPIQLQKPEKEAEVQKTKG